ncbi:hypothetical protein D3C73_977780 [compost metagenome]
MGSHLMFEPAHTLMKIAELPAHIFAKRRFFIMRIGIHNHTALSAQRIGPAANMGFNVRANIHGKIVFPERLKCAQRLLFIQYPRKPNLKSPALPIYLIDMAGIIGA